jgi:hypothetical protein
MRPTAGSERLKPPQRLRKAPQTPRGFTCSPHDRPGRLRTQPTRIRQPTALRTPYFRTLVLFHTGGGANSSAAFSAGSAASASSTHIRGGTISTGQGARRATDCAVPPSSARFTAP